MPRIRPLIKGVASFAVPWLRTTHKRTGTASAEDCYSIFHRHFALLRSTGVSSIPRIVAELGPGSSHGTGFAALIAGAEKYYALDLMDHSDAATNIRVFDDLVGLFRRRAEIPARGRFSLIYPDLDSYAFPEAMNLGSAETFDGRVKAIRQDIVARSGAFFEVAAPWMESNLIREQTVDWLWSHSALEHVDDLSGTYGAVARWLKRGAYSTNVIDFDCHGLTREWNGHWALKDSVWNAIRGRRPYLLNRAWLETHLKLAASNGLRVVMQRRNLRFDGLVTDQFVPRYRAMSDEDSRTRMAFVVLQRTGGDI
jgi:hypothetical protein